MKKLLLNLALAVSVSTFAQTANTEVLKFYFAKDQYDLTENSIHKLDSLLGTITDPSEDLLLVGHTDSDADVSYNKTLSLNRTRAVQSYLYNHNVRNRIHIDWKGESKPINANKDEERKRLTEELRSFEITEMKQIHWSASKNLQ
jgi:outer membrane protein OmpA-like peptidoglycan-associated protein